MVFLTMKYAQSTMQKILHSVSYSSILLAIDFFYPLTVNFNHVKINNVTQTSATESKRAARTERRREQTRTEILNAAREIVLRDGVAGFAISAVAEELGLTKPALYYYFGSKEALTFELLLREWVAAATEVQAAVEKTEGGADAIETLMRTIFNRYREQLNLFMFCYGMVPTGDLSTIVAPEDLQRVRPVNDMLYKGVEDRLCADQRAGRFSKKRDSRRFAFTAHTAVIGLLNMIALVSASSDPLIHGDEDLINDICQTYRNCTEPKGAK